MWELNCDQCQILQRIGGSGGCGGGGGGFKTQRGVIRPQVLTHSTLHDPRHDVSFDSV